MKKPPAWDTRLTCRPAQKGNSKRVVYVKGKPRLLSSRKDERAERDLIGMLLMDAPPEPFSGPLRLELEILHPIPKSWPKWRQAAAQDGHVVPSGGGTQDSGNVLKLVEDALESAGWLLNDCQVVEHRISALYDDVPGYRITLGCVPGVLGPEALLADLQALLSR